MKNFKRNDKGITLVTVVIYVISLIIAIGILATVTTYFYSNFRDMNDYTDDIAEFDKFNLYFLEEVKRTGNEIKEISLGRTSIEFTSGNKYNYNSGDKVISLINSSGNVKIAEKIESCTFESYEEDSKIIIKVDITIGSEQRIVEYVLGYGNKYANYQSESNYIATTKEKTLAELVEDGTVKIGDYVAYEPTTAIWDWSTEVSGNTYATYSGSTDNIGTLTTESLNWRVLDIVDGQVILISELPTGDTVSLQGANGYNNAVKLLNELCNTLYSKSGVGTARSLKIEDIQSKMNVTDPSEFNSDYGNNYSPTHADYPAIFENENRQLGNPTTGKLGLSEQDTWYIGYKTATATMNTAVTSWGTWLGEGDFCDDIYLSLFFCNDLWGYNKAWLASRCVKTWYYNTGFAVRHLQSDGYYGGEGGSVFASEMFWEGWYDRPDTLPVRPAVTLTSVIRVTGGDGTSSNPWIIQ